jgi:4'-phosphopantetheinyl transferase
MQPIHVYTIEYPCRIPDMAFYSLLARLPEDIQQKIKRYRRWQDTYGCLFGKYLLLSALQDNGHPDDLERMQYTIHGRPYLVNGPDFNISHSGSRAVCAIAQDDKIGIDIEEIKSMDISDFKDQFSTAEWQTIITAPDQLDAFYCYWTAKECILKADGRGITASLSRLEIDGCHEIVFEDRRWNLLRIPSFNNYACHIASGKPAAGFRLKELTSDELLSFYP